MCGLRSFSVWTSPSFEVTGCRLQSARNRMSRSRWVVALSAVALVTALTAAIVYALVGRSPEATVLGYVPSGAVVYGEVRLDLPGDQRREILR